MMSNEEFQKKWMEISKKLGEITELSIQDPDNTQILYEALAYELGFVDGVGCLGAVPRDFRLRSKEKFFKAGKKSAYDSHLQLCLKKDCSASESLDLELNGN